MGGKKPNEDVFFLDTLFGIVQFLHFSWELIAL